MNIMPGAFLPAVSGCLLARFTGTPHFQAPLPRFLNKRTVFGNERLQP